MMTEPKANETPAVSSFDVDDIRKIREYNSIRHLSMTRAEIVEDTKAGAADLMQLLCGKNVKIVRL